jgi:hypothetical protein
MASLPSDPGPILGRVDSHGRLIAADRELERLQVEAGSRVGATVAIPQLAEVARIAARLRIPVSRRVLAGDPENAMTAFDHLSDEQVDSARKWLRLDTAYRSAICALDSDHGQSSV